MAESDLRNLLKGIPSFETFGQRIEWLEGLEAEYRDDVRDHAEGVAYFSVQLAEAVGFSEEDIIALHQAARWHDIGKLKTPDDVLNKPGRLTDTERAVMTKHGREGNVLLGDDAPKLWKDVVLYHHERYDGFGYEGLKGEAIPFAARIVAIADVHDALIRERVYKQGMSEEQALLLMSGNVESPGFGRRAFDPALLRAFVAMRLNDPQLDVSMDSRRTLEQFAVSNPMNDIKGGMDSNDLWYIKSSGHRLLYSDSGPGKRILMMLGPNGESEFVQPELRQQMPSDGYKQMAMTQ